MAHRPFRARGARLLAACAAILGATTVVAMVVQRPTGTTRPDLREIGVVSEVYDAVVEVVDFDLCTGVPAGEEGPLCTKLTLRLLQGPDQGQTVTLDVPDTPTAIDLSVGETAVLGRQEDAEPGFEYFLVDRERRPVLIALAALFAIAVVLLGRFRGLAALGGLGVSLAILILFVLPAILDGRSPLPVAITGAAAISFFALYLAHGFTTMTTVALLGTLGSLAVTATLAAVFTELAEITGFTTEEALLLQAAGGQINLAGLILGGMVIGALGVIDDVTVTQASAVWELRRANPSMASRDLYRAGLRIGRDHVASTVNTLVLAYAGASMPLLVLFVLSRQSLGTVANGEVVAIEIVRTLVGSVGLVASVPITTWLAARTAGSTREGPRTAPSAGERATKT